MEPDWSLYRTFLAVLRDGSLSGAARRLGLTQPTVGRQLDQLEAAVGAPLFVRSQRGLTPTALAQALGPHAAALEIDAAALLRAASGEAGTIEGTVRISASEVVGVEHLPPILARLRQRHPRLVVELALSNEADDLARRAADIAVRMFPLEQDALVARKLKPLACGLFARRDYLARRGTPATMADLADHDLIGFDRETPMLRALAARFPTLGRDAFALRATSDLAQLAAIRAGFGIGVCQASLARRTPSLTRVLPDAFTVDLDLSVVMHESLRASPRCRAVFDGLVEGLSRLA